MKPKSLIPLQWKYAKVIRVIDMNPFTAQIAFFGHRLDAFPTGSDVEVCSPYKTQKHACVVNCRMHLCNPHLI